MPHDFPPPWTVEQIPDGYKVKDANGQVLAYVYARETRADASIANVLTMDELGDWRATSPSCRRCLNPKRNDERPVVWCGRRNAKNTVPNSTE